MENYARKTSTGQSRKTNWRDRQVVKVNGKVGKKDEHRTVKKDNWRDRQAVKVNSKRKQERQELTGKRVKLARQTGSEGK